MPRQSDQKFEGAFLPVRLTTGGVPCPPGMDHIQKCGHYSPEGIRVWADKLVADPWLIAYARTRSMTIVTLEKPTIANQTRKRKNPKIPDVAADLHVGVMSLTEMMRALGIRL